MLLRENERLICSENINFKKNVHTNLKQCSKTANNSLSALDQPRLNHAKSIVLGHLNIDSISNRSSPLKKPFSLRWISSWFQKQQMLKLSLT